MSYAIETHNLKRIFETYKKPEGIWNSIKAFRKREYIQKIALNDTNLQIKAGQIVGLVGANGAGKTTLLKILSGLIVPTSGDAKVLGFTPWERKHEYQRKISILLGQKNQLWWDIAPMDSYSLLASIYDLDQNKAKARVTELAQMLKCEHVLHVQLRRLSLGERMKMEIIGALLHEPEILFLDEPTIGLDIVAQSTIREFLQKYVDERKPTIILTSHYMDDIAKLADHLLLISQGNIVYDGTVDTFMARTENTQQLYVGLSENLSRDIILDRDVEMKSGSQEFNLKIKSDNLPRYLAEIGKHASIKSLKIEEVDFEDVIRKFLETESRVR